MQKTSSSHTTKVDAAIREPTDENEFKCTAVPPPSEVQKVSAAKEPEITTVTAKMDARALQFSCEAADIGDNMVCTIEKAREFLGRGNVKVATPHKATRRRDSGVLIPTGD
jgi:hypothetical protein